MELIPIIDGWIQAQESDEEARHIVENGHIPVAPFLGEHNQQILFEYLGYSGTTVAELEETGILCSERIPQAAERKTKSTTL